MCHVDDQTLTSTLAATQLPVQQNYSVDKLRGLPQRTSSIFFAEIGPLPLLSAVFRLYNDVLNGSTLMMTTKIVFRLLIDNPPPLICNVPAAGEIFLGL